MPHALVPTRYASNSSSTLDQNVEQKKLDPKPPMQGAERWLDGEVEFESSRKMLV